MLPPWCHHGHILQCSLGFGLPVPGMVHQRLQPHHYLPEQSAKLPALGLGLFQSCGITRFLYVKCTASPSVKSAFCKLLGLELSLFQELFHWSPQPHHRLKGSSPSFLVLSLACPELHHQSPLACYHQNSSKHLPHCSGTITS